VERTAQSTRDAKGLARTGTAQTPAARDVDASIRSRARVVRSADLARKLKKVQILDVATIRDLIEEAVAEAAESFDKSLAEEERRRLLEEAEETFKARLANFKAEKAGLESRTKHLVKELERAQSLLEEERRRIVSADQFTVSDAGILELEKRLGRMLDLVVRRGGVSGELEQEMRAVVAKLLDDERQRISAKAQEAQNDRVDLLERKIARLASTLEETQKERDRAFRRAQALEAAGVPGFQNWITGGIRDDDPDRERRLELMKEIVDFNKAMYAELAALGRLPPTRPRPAAVPAPEAGTQQAQQQGPKQEPRSTASPDGDTEVIEVPLAQRDEAGLRGAGSADSADSAQENGESQTGAASGPDAATAAAEGSAEDPVDPDDLPWEPPADEVVAREVEVSKSRGVKTISVKQFAPPPLERRRQPQPAAASAGPVEGA
jgi:hypothetical protein